MGVPFGKNKKETTSSSTATAAPPSWADQNMKTGAADALKFYQQGKGQEVYQGQRTINDLSDQTKAGQSQIGDIAGKLMNTSDTSSGSNLQDMATSNGQNPYFQQALRNQLDNVRDMTANQMSASGVATGSQGGQMARALGQTATSAFSDQYNKDMQNKLAANALIDQSRNALTDRQLAAAKSNVNSGILSSALEQMKLDAARQKFNEESMAPWKGLGLLGGASRSFSDGYGTTSSTGSTTASSNRLDDAMGGIMQGVGQGIAMLPFL